MAEFGNFRIKIFADAEGNKRTEAFYFTDGKPTYAKFPYELSVEVAKRQIRQ